MTRIATREIGRGLWIVSGEVTAAIEILEGRSRDPMKWSLAKFAHLRGQPIPSATPGAIPPGDQRPVARSPWPYMVRVSSGSGDLKLERLSWRETRPERTDNGVKPQGRAPRLHCFSTNCRNARRDDGLPELTRSNSRGMEIAFPRNESEPSAVTPLNLHSTTEPLLHVRSGACCLLASATSTPSPNELP